MSEPGKSLFKADDFEETLNRIHRLTSQAQRHWGKMTIGQMLTHCSEVQEVLNGKELKNTPLIARIFKKMVRRVAIGPKRYKKGEITHPQYIVRTDPEFDSARKRLLEALHLFYADKGPGKHILFGEMTVEERGWTAFKHLDHHLTQFGV